MTYDPSDIRIETRSIAIYDLLPKIWFQDVNSPWNDRLKSSLIESILIRIPIQCFYIRPNEENRDFRKIVDGKKRLLAIK